MPTEGEGTTDGADYTHDMAPETRSEIGHGDGSDSQETGEQVEPERAETIIGDVSIEEWIRGGCSEYQNLPQVRNAEDLKIVLGLKEMLRDSFSVYRNWLKLPKDFPEKEWFVFLEYLAENWLLKSNDLRTQAPEEWSQKFRDIVEMLADQMELPQSWLDASTHARFMCHYQPEYLIKNLRESVASDQSIQETVHSQLDEESRSSGQPMDRDEFERRIALQRDKNNIIWTNAAKLAEANNVEFDGDVNAQIQANSQRRSSRRY
ncbi:MAG: hypothetical protein Q7S80_00245 [bacterium]|nr:hypothetical protein [bacterium]